MDAAQVNTFGKDEDGQAVSEDGQEATVRHMDVDQAVKVLLEEATPPLHDMISKWVLLLLLSSLGVCCFSFPCVLCGFHACLPNGYPQSAEQPPQHKLSGTL